MPWMIVSAKDESEFCVHKQNADKTAGEKLKCYPDKKDADAYMKALYANAPKSEHMTNEEMLEVADKVAESERRLPVNMALDNFLFVEMSEELSGEKFIDALASGTYTAMNGKVVTFRPEELPEYVANTQAIIDSTRDSSGVPVGLPIDLDKHDHAGGAGWVVGVDLDKARNVVRLAVNWLDDGKNVITKNIRRFFSPSTNPANKTILGGSLTNWPASRSGSGQVMLRPVELSEQLQEINMEEFIGTLVKLPNQIALALRETQSEIPLEGASTMGDKTEFNARTVELLETPGLVREHALRAKEQAELLVKAERRLQQVVDYATTLVGGTAAKPFGLPIPADEVVEFIMSLDEEHGNWAMRIFTQAHQAAIEFAEKGSNMTGGPGSFIGKPMLPEWAKAQLKKWLEAKRPMAEFFTENPEVGGTAKDFNLAEFVQKEN